MKRIDLIKINHQTKIGDLCEYRTPNVLEDSIFYEDGKPIGFYLTKLTDKGCKLADLANYELRSKNVPKSVMTRQIPDGKNPDGTYKYRNSVDQYSTIIGSVPPKPHMKRAYKNISSVHAVKSAQTFIKAMLMLVKESESMIADILPDQYKKQIELFRQVPDKWKFGNIFTSSISNYNISAPFHRDTGNIQNTVNVIICKKLNCIGGDLHVPDYDATIGQVDNSILVYPAWKNVHGVTPITPTQDGGFRNSLVFYPLRAFVEE
jgi:hypothetical protein